MTEKKKFIGMVLKKPRESASVVYSLTFLFTFIVLLMFLGEALCKCGILKYGFQTPDALVYFYLYLLSVYVYNKEILDRWILQLIWRRRPGEFLVLTWALAALILWILEYLSRGNLYPPGNMIMVTEFVLGAFIASAVSKHAYHKKKRNGKGPTQHPKPSLAQA